MSNGTRVQAFLSNPIPRPPTVVRVAAAIVLGAATTVAVAWSLAYFVNGSLNSMYGAPGFSMDVAVQLISTPPGSTEVDLEEVTRHRCWGTEVVEVWGPVINGQPYGSLHALVEGTSFAGEMKEKFDRGEAATAWWRADGWPIPALRAEARWSSYADTGVSKVVGVLVGSRHVMPTDGVRMLPLQPIWSGLVIDTVLYASLWFALFSMGDIRTILRRRRGLCGHCGYRLLPEQSRCSECGQPRLRFTKKRGCASRVHTKSSGPSAEISPSPHGA